MKFTLALSLLPAELVLPMARAAETHGWDAVTFGDSVFYPERVSADYPYSADGSRFWPDDTPFVDPLVGLPAVGAATERLGLRTNVIKAVLRDPLLLAKSIGSLAAMFPGRVGIGVGLSWIPEEFRFLGLDMKTRGKRLDEQIEVIRALLEGGYAEFHGNHFDFDRLRMDPAPAPGDRVPIYVGGHSEAAMRRAATLGDGWIGATATEDELADLIGRLRGVLAEAGRAGEPFEVKASPLVDLTPDAMARVADMGLTDAMVVPWYSFPGGDPHDPRHMLDAVAWFAETVILPLRDRAIVP